MSEYDPCEQEDILRIFKEMLRACTTDGGVKRAAGTKPLWKDDPGHEGAFWSHVSKWKKGETHDPDSGVHPMRHAAWRALAIAWQEESRIRDAALARWDDNGGAA